LALISNVLFVFNSNKGYKGQIERQAAGLLSLVALQHFGSYGGDFDESTPS
jgi:hypothetical protein